MKKNLLVTLADENYIDQAKQFFSSVYWNAEWRGDCLLLSHCISKNRLKWFKDRGILVYECGPLVKGKSYGRLPSIVIDKIHLFKKYFKKWRNVIYIDGDTIVKGSLNGLLNEDNFSAVQDLRDFFIQDQIIEENEVKSVETKQLYNEIKKKYPLKSVIFNCGFFVFNTSIIQDNSFREIYALSKKYKDISVKGEQSILNFYFYKKWRPLPCAYNFPPYLVTHPVFFTDSKIKAIILHFIGSNKPWQTRGLFYEQWKNNLGEAEKINFKKHIKSSKIWSENEIKKCSNRLIIRKIFYTPIFYLDRIIGSVSIFVRKTLKFFR